MRIIIFLVLILFGIISCEQGKKNVDWENISIKVSYNANLIPSGEKLSFDIDSKTINRSICMIHYVAPDSSEYLFYLNGQGNDIYVFSLDSGKVVKTVKLDNQGPNGVGSMVRGFEVLNLNSLYITSAFRRRLYLVNSDAKLLSTIDYSKYKQDQDNYIHAGITWTFSNQRIGFKDGLIYLPFHPGYDEGNYKTVLPENIRMIAVLDTINKTAGTLNIGFPKDFWQNQFYPVFFGFFIYKGTFFINYDYDNRILVSKNSQDWDSYVIQSKFVDVKNVIPPERGDGANYCRFVADPYRDIFYRFVIHEQTGLKDRTTLDMIRYPKYFSIIILDSNFNIIGETLFPPDTYDAHGYFITKDGLYLSLSNPYNPEYNIDKLEFKLFKLIQNEKE